MGGTLNMKEDVWELHPHEIAGHPRGSVVAAREGRAIKE